MSASVANFSGAVDKLRLMRDEKVRNSKEVVDIWNTFLCDNPNGLGNDKWLILEQVYMAGLDVGDWDLAEEVLNTLNARFSGGMRIKRLTAMWYEANCEFEKAEEIYSRILEEDPVDSATQKRFAALCRSQGKISEAVQTLNKYLEINPMDYEGWMELGELYLDQLEYDKAAFCFEELIVINPYNHLFHLKYADIKYSQGEFELARVYYSQAYRMSAASARSMYGYILCCQKLAAGKGKSKAENIAMAKTALLELNSKFESLKAPTRNVNKKAMETMMDAIM